MKLIEIKLIKPVKTKKPIKPRKLITPTKQNNSKTNKLADETDDN